MNKKKILLCIGLVLIVIAIICVLIIVLNNNSTNEVAEEIKDNEIVEENANVDTEIAEEIDSEEIEESTETQNEKTVEAISTPETSKIKTPTPVVQKQENTENKQTIATPTVQVETQDTEEKSESNTPTITPEEPKETFSVNYEMIEKIKQTIINNESEYMKTYGYEIVVDSSIKELTNPFTYTELRVKNAVRNKFGTIRIYAENYYVGGQLIMVDCYII